MTQQTFTKPNIQIKIEHVNLYPVYSNLGKCKTSLGLPNENQEEAKVTRLDIITFLMTKMF